MKAFVGVTDSSWFEFLKANQPDEVNFWQPSGKTRFGALSVGELFLFKLHAPQNFIVGGGYFVRSALLPTFLAWQAFGIKNGVSTLDVFHDRIRRYRKVAHLENPTIGCIILSNPFFFDEDDWIPIPSDWAPNIVRGKTYSDDTNIGKRLIDDVLVRVQTGDAVGEEAVRWGVTTTSYRLGQGGFRISVTEAYDRRCAISGEKTLPILDAAHIKPVSREGVHAVSNGLLLRTDIHSLYDLGYITVTPDYHIEVSARLQDEYGNGKLYYGYDRLLVPNLPKRVEDRPSVEFLQWHNENVFR